MEKVLLRVVFWMVLVGCTGSRDGPAVAVRDSAGVRIVENREPVWEEGEGISVDPEPYVVIGAAAGPEEDNLTRVMDAAVLPDGSIALIDGGASEVQLRASDGSHIRTLGRRGGGPGEFNSPRWLAVRSDTLLVFDPFQGYGRLTLYTLSGDLLGMEALEVEGLDYPSPDALLPDGSYFDERAEGSIDWAEVGHVVYTRYPIRYGRMGGPVDTLTTAPGSEAWRESFANGISQSEVPFGRASHMAMGSDRIYLSNGARPVIDAFSFEGEHLVSIRIDVSSIPVTEQERDRWIEARLSQVVYEGRPELADRARRGLMESPLPSHMPAHADLRVDGRDRLWAQVYHPPWDEANEWWVFDPDGRWQGTASLPHGLAPFEVGDDYVLGLRTDALGVEYVELYHLTDDTRSQEASG